MKTKKIISIKEITEGEPKLRIDGGFSIYIFGLEIRFTVYKWEVAINLGVWFD